MLCRAFYRAPFGLLELTCREDALLGIRRLPEGEANAPPATDRHPLLARAAEELDAYFAGELQNFDLPLDPAGTDFQKRVWRALCKVPYGTTVTYGALAAAVGCPGAARAVGGAVGANPILILVPCHRAVAAGGLGGFSAGLDAKRALLEVEHIVFPAL